MKIILSYCIAVLFMSTSGEKAPTKKLLSAKVEIESFDTMTSASVTCEEFPYVFKGSKKSITFKNRDDIDSLTLLIRSFNEVEDNYSFDVRGKITFQYQGSKESYCFDRFATFTNKGERYQNLSLLKFIERRQFSNDPDQLK